MRRVILVFGIIAVCLVLFLVERYIGWPDWLSLEPRQKNSLPKF